MTTAAFGLITIGRVLLLVTKLLFFGECFPLVLDFRRLILPLLADDLRDFWIRKA